MLTLAALNQLAQEHGLKFHARYPTSAPGIEALLPTSISIWFHEVCVEAWKTLTTSLTEVPVSLNGTRQVSGSGAIDGRLYPEYAVLLDEINAARAVIGLGRICG